jgi:hypothetical protein
VDLSAESLTIWHNPQMVLQQSQRRGRYNLSEGDKTSI